MTEKFLETWILQLFFCSVSPKRSDMNKSLGSWAKGQSQNVSAPCWTQKLHPHQCLCSEFFHVEFVSLSRNLFSQVRYPERSWWLRNLALETGCQHQRIVSAHWPFGKILWCFKANRQNLHPLLQGHPRNLKWHYLLSKFLFWNYSTWEGVTCICLLSNFLCPSLQYRSRRQGISPLCPLPYPRAYHSACSIIVMQ